MTESTNNTVTVTDSPAEEAIARQAIADVYQPPLQAHCYRLLGSTTEADIAAHETLIRAWHGFDRCESRGVLQMRLYRTATSVCLELLRDRQRAEVRRNRRTARPNCWHPAVTAVA